MPSRRARLRTASTPSTPNMTGASYSRRSLSSSFLSWSARLTIISALASRSASSSSADSAVPRSAFFLDGVYLSFGSPCVILSNSHCARAFTFALLSLSVPKCRSCISTAPFCHSCILAACSALSPPMERTGTELMLCDSASDAVRISDVNPRESPE